MPSSDFRSEGLDIRAGERASTPRLRLLFLLPFAPRFDATHGGGRATAQLIARLARRHEVGVLYVRSHEAPAADDAIRTSAALVEEAVRPPVGSDARYRWSVRARNGTSMLRGRPRRATVARLPAFEHSLHRIIDTWRPDILHIFEEMAQYAFALQNRRAPRVLTVHEPGVSAARERLRASHGARRLRDRLDLLAWQRFEKRALESVDAAVVLTDRDRARLARFETTVAIQRIPLGTEPPEAPLDPVGADDDGVVFVGSYPHAPNVDAGLRLTGSIFPQVRTRRPDATLTLVGTRPPPELRAAAGSGVTITGAVPDVAPYLDRAAVVALPIRLGGGMRVKLLEALAAGKAVVASRLAAEGLALADGIHVVFAETDDEFTEAIVLLLGDRDLRRAVAVNARAWANEHLGWQARVEAYEQLYRSLLRAA